MGSVLKEQENKNIILSSIPTRQYINNAIQSSNIDPKMTLMPSKFRNADGATTFSVGRIRFLKTFAANKNNNINHLTKKYQELGYNCKINCNHIGCTRNNNLDGNVQGKFINVQSSDQRTQRIKNDAIGRGTFATKNSKDKYELSLQGLTNRGAKDNVQHRHLRSVRNRGYVVPPRVVRYRNAAGIPSNMPNSCVPR